MENTLIINYGMGNLRSIQHKLSKIDIDANISNKAEEIENAKFLILPGVGHFARGMENLNDLGLVPVLNEMVLERHVPVLGICLGMQLLSEFSEEGDAKGLGWIQGATKLFRLENGFKVPHIGWKSMSFKGHPILDGVERDQRFYFVHSYHFTCQREEDVLMRAAYGGQEFVAAVLKGNILGTQFHPEKSHRRGMELIRNFYRHAVDPSVPV
jgi:glutamine amidotransferase